MLAPEAVLVFCALASLGCALVDYRSIDGRFTESQSRHFNVALFWVKGAATKLQDEAGLMEGRLCNGRCVADASDNDRHHKKGLDPSPSLYVPIRDAPNHPATGHQRGETAPHF